MTGLVKQAESGLLLWAEVEKVPLVHKYEAAQLQLGDSGRGKTVCLLTGRPGTGKTSLIKQTIAGLNIKAGGFYTEEIRGQGVRQGFRLVTLGGETAVLAHVDIKGPHRVGRYGVDVDRLDSVGVAALLRAAGECELVVVDEIGKMELFSPRFREAVSQIIESGQMVLGTIMLNPHPWADAVKQKPLVRLMVVNRVNYSQVLAEVRNWLNTGKEI